MSPTGLCVAMIEGSSRSMFPNDLRKADQITRSQIGFLLYLNKALIVLEETNNN